MVTALRLVREFASGPEWDSYLVARFGAVGEASSDAELLEAARQTAVTIWHPVSTARMSPTNASWGVVNPNLLLKGAHGLRIADASVIVSLRLTSSGHSI